MTRFFLQPSELVDLVMAALGRMRGGEVFIRRMPAIAIGELAEALRLELAPQLGVDPDAVAVEVVGPRPGETQHEQIMTAREADRVVADGALLAILPEATDERTPEPPAGFAPTDDVVRSSAAAEPLALEEIRAAIAAEAPVVVDG
jgi:FlaA1/EpsC-like NDP-sugar epimerase